MQEIAKTYVFFWCMFFADIADLLFLVSKMFNTGLLDVSCFTSQPQLALILLGTYAKSNGFFTGQLHDFSECFKLIQADASWTANQGFDSCMFGGNFFWLVHDQLKKVTCKS